MILVTGAGGKTGQLVVRALVRAGATVRAFVHRQEQASLMQSFGVTDVVVGDMRDAQTVVQAMHGVRAVYHICPSVQPDEADIGKAMIDAARAAGVERFVYHSVMHPQIDALPHHAQKLQVESYLIQSELPYTILQPASYMQNALMSWKQIAQDGVYAMAYGVNSRMSLVDLEDIGTVAAMVLTEDGHQAATYELSGPQALTAAEVASILTDHLGRPVTAEELPVEQWAQRARAAGFGDYQVDTLATMFRYYVKHGYVGNPHVLTCLLRRPPTNLATFVERTMQQRTGEK